MRVAAAQIDIEVAAKQRNLDTIERSLGEAAGRGVELVVFPECTLTGYVITDQIEVAALAEEVPGASTARVAALCRELGLAAVVGLLERDGDAFYNTVVLVDGGGVVGRYRKSHLIQLGVDRLLSRGDVLPVFPTTWGMCGLLICYDQRFPEAARTLALRGARVILNPANLPQGAEAHAAFFNRARACENRVYVVNANRIGSERGFTFIGRSQIIDPRGAVLAEAGPTGDELLVADIWPGEADQKHVVVIPEDYEFDVVQDRRPDLYGPMWTDPPSACGS
ncbi:MAG: carbon-nitrogen hydrolase family protein [Thermoleophilia bacterium]